MDAARALSHGSPESVWLFIRRDGRGEIEGRRSFHPEERIGILLRERDRPTRETLRDQGYKLSVDHGEPIPHPKSQIAILEVLSKMFQLDVDMSDLVAQSRELAEAIQKAEIEGLEVDEDGEISGTRRTPQGDDIYR